MNQEEIVKYLRDKLFRPPIDEEVLEELLYDELTTGKSKWIMHTSGKLERIPPNTSWVSEFDKKDINSLRDYHNAIQHYNVLKRINQIEDEEMFLEWYKEQFPDNYEEILENKNKIDGKNQRLK